MVAPHILLLLSVDLSLEEYNHKEFIMYLLDLIEGEHNILNQINKEYNINLNS